MSPQVFLADSHPSLNASMDDFEAREFSPTIPDLPSQHSGFRSGNNSEYSEHSSRRSYSPPAWRKAGSGWFKHQQVRSVNTRFESATPPYPGMEDEDDDVTAYRTARKIPLPASPVKGRTPSESPEPVEQSTPCVRQRTQDVTPTQPNAHAQSSDRSPSENTPTKGITQNNYIRFSTSLDVMHHTEPIDAMLNTIRKTWRHVTQSKYNALFYALSSLAAYWLVVNLFAVPTSGPSPNLMQVASLAKGFEPVIYYSEKGQDQIEQLQETGLAVWDLGESVRSTNMTSAPLITKQLDELSDNLKFLAHELTIFFASVDSDVDSIINSMEWAQLTLGAIESTPSTISSVWSNTNTMLANVGLSAESRVVQQIFGQTYQQRTKAALERSFYDILNSLEAAIANELKFSIKLFGIFESIDKQLLGLQRTVIREQDQQERSESEILGSLWTKVIGVNAGQLRKYERNKDLLHSLRERTVDNKGVLLNHEQRLLSLKSNLEVLRQKLVSPLVRSTNSSVLSLEDQLRGLDSTYQELKRTREDQKVKVRELVFKARPKSLASGNGQPIAIEAA